MGILNEQAYQKIVHFNLVPNSMPLFFNRAEEIRIIFFHTRICKEKTLSKFGLTHSSF